MSCEVSRASQIHHVPHIGLPQAAPVNNAIAVITAPTGVEAVWALLTPKNKMAQKSNRLLKPQCITAQPRPDLIINYIINHSCQYLVSHLNMNIEFTGELNMNS